MGDLVDDIFWEMSTDTATTHVNRSERSVSSDHIALFRVRDGVLDDLHVYHYSPSPFIPEVISASWRDGALHAVNIVGNNRKKDGTRGQQSKNRRFINERLAELPDLVKQRITLYWLAHDHYLVGGHCLEEKP